MCVKTFIIWYEKRNRFGGFGSFQLIFISLFVCRVRHFAMSWIIVKQIHSIHVVFFFSETLTPASVPPSFVLSQLSVIHGFLYKHFFFNIGIWRLLQHAAQSIHMLLNEWVFLCLPYMFSFHLNSHDSQQCVQSTTPCTFLYRSPYCILLFPYVSLNGAYYWRTPLEVGIMCAQTYFLDAVS